MLPFVEPGRLMIKVSPSVPAVALESLPRGFTSLIDSASPGASRSSTLDVPSGVRSRGPNHVPPVVTINP